MNYYLAIDIGASSGRHIVGWENDGKIMTDEVYRFDNGPDKLGESLVWDTERLFLEVKRGIAAALLKYPKIISLSIDTWGVDYVLMRGDEAALPAYAYRDERGERAAEFVHRIISKRELFSRTGTTYMSFNTIYQLYYDKLCGRLEGVTDLLMMPEYLMYRLTGKRLRERTNATTTGLVNALTHEYDEEIFERLGLPECLMRPLSDPGASLGGLLPEVIDEVGGDIEVVLCATHDTASAVEAIEMKENAPYISSGTWSLLGVKTEAALTDDKSRRSGYSNEGGIGYNRYQKNIAGMWIVQRLRAELCPELSYVEITDMALRSKFIGSFDVDDPCLLAPKSMKGVICERLGIFEDSVGAADLFNAAYVSLALGYRRAIADLEKNTGKTYTELYIVGGGAKNNYLNSLTEQYTGKRVIALPIEATAIGNLKVQMKGKRK